MKLSDIKKKARQLEESKQKTSAPEASLADKTIKHDPKYPRKVALTLAISHIIFAITISIWYLHIYIFKPNGFGCIVYLLEFPGAIIIKMLGQAQSTEIYILAFFINTIFYGFLGYLLGRIFQKYGWDKEIRTLCKLETEVYEKEIEPEEI